MIVSHEDLAGIRDGYPDQKLVFRKGCFDLFHAGHLAALQQSKDLGSVLAVGVVPDKRVTERKGLSRPVIGQDDRLVIVNAIKYVNYAFIMPERTEFGNEPTWDVLALLRPDIYVVPEHNSQKWLKQREQLGDLGVALAIDHQGVSEISTTNIINTIITQPKADVA